MISTRTSEQVDIPDIWLDQDVHFFKAPHQVVCITISSTSMADELEANKKLPIPQAKPEEAPQQKGTGDLIQQLVGLLESKLTKDGELANTVAPFTAQIKEMEKTLQAKDEIIQQLRLEAQLMTQAHRSALECRDMDTKAQVAIAVADARSGSRFKCTATQLCKTQTSVSARLA
jgi:hypothetical protein